MEPQFADILSAQERLQALIGPSPLVRANELSRMLGAQVFLKLENLQETGSFKVRGACNRLAQLTPEERDRGVITASAGNHAQGVAWGCARLGMEALIVMPEDVSVRKLVAVKEYGGGVLLFGSSFDEAYGRARELARQEGRVFIPPFDDPLVIAGQGTIALELFDLLEEDPEGTTVIAPVGGGGLIGGLALGIKERFPRTRIMGVQARSCPSALRSREEGRPVCVDASPTLADGIAVKRPGDLTFPLIQARVDDLVAVGEEAIAGAVLTLIERVHVVAEGAGACPLAALLEQGDRLGARRFVLVVSGGNIETGMIDRILQRGAIRMGQLIRIQVNLLDAPGSLAGLLDVVAQKRANILHIFHDRLALDNPIQVSRVELNLETRGPDHAEEVIEALRLAGYDVEQAPVIPGPD